MRLYSPLGLGLSLGLRLSSIDLTEAATNFQRFWDAFVTPVKSSKRDKGSYIECSCSLEGTLPAKLALHYLCNAPLSLDASRHRIAWHGMAWHGMAWHGMAWHGLLDASRQRWKVTAMSVKTEP